MTVAPRHTPRSAAGHAGRDRRAPGAAACASRPPAASCSRRCSRPTGPATAEELAAGVPGRVPESDLASIYRNLDTLERDRPRARSIASGMAPAATCSATSPATASSTAIGCRALRGAARAEPSRRCEIVLREQYALRTAPAALPDRSPWLRRCVRAASRYGCRSRRSVASRLIRGARDGRVLSEASSEEHERSRALGRRAARSAGCATSPAVSHPASSQIGLLPAARAVIPAWSRNSGSREPSFSERCAHCRPSTGRPFCVSAIRAHARSCAGGRAPDAANQLQGEGLGAVLSLEQDHARVRVQALCPLPSMLVVPQRVCPPGSAACPAASSASRGRLSAPRCWRR